MRIAVLSLLAALAALATQDQLLFEDKFAGKLADGWTWLREDAGGWKVDGGALKIKAQPGKLWYKTKTAKNVALRKLGAAGTADAPVALEVTVESTPDANSEQCGLYLHFDDGNFVKIIREHLKGKNNILMVRELKNIPEPQKPVEEASGTVRLRLVWSGAKVHGFYKTTGDWVPVGEVDSPSPDGAANAALACHGGAADNDHWTKFTDFRVVKTGK